MSSISETQMTPDQVAAEIAECERIVQFAKVVLLGTHPRVKLPEGMEDEAARRYHDFSQALYSIANAVPQEVPALEDAINIETSNEPLQMTKFTGIEDYISLPTDSHEELAIRKIQATRKVQEKLAMLLKGKMETKALAEKKMALAVTVKEERARKWDEASHRLKLREVERASEVAKQSMLDYQTELEVTQLVGAMDEFVIGSALLVKEDLGVYFRVSAIRGEKYEDCKMPMVARSTEKKYLISCIGAVQDGLDISAIQEGLENVRIAD